MKKIIVSLLTAIALLFGTAIPAAGAWISPDFTEYTAEFTADAPLDESSDYYLAKKLTVKEDFTLPRGNSLYIRAGGELVIKNGATFTANGDVTVERGGILSVKKGNFTAAFVLDNYGKIEVAKDGSLTVRGDGNYGSGATYDSNAGSVLIQEGEILFGELRLSDLTERILKYDKNFSLDSYCIHAYNCGAKGVFFNHDIFLNYCIGDVETDYSYRAKNNAAHPKLSRKSYSLSRVYNAQRAEKVRRTAEKYADETELYRYYDDPSYYKINIGFTYSYKTRMLGVFMTGFHAGYDSDYENAEDRMIMDKVIEEPVGRV